MQTASSTVTQAGSFLATQCPLVGAPLAHFRRGLLVGVVTFALSAGAAANTLPLASNGSLVTDEDTTADSALLATDADGDALTFRIVAQGAKGLATVTDPATGAFDYTPRSDANGTDSFTFTANDGTGDGNVATVTVTINAVPDPPTAAFTATPMIGSGPLTVLFDASASFDPDGAIAAVEWVFGDGTSGTGITTSHTYYDVGSYTPTLTVRDTSGLTDWTATAITVDNLSPVVADLPAEILIELGQTADAEIGDYASDPDGDPLSYVGVGFELLPGDSAMVDADTGQFVWQPDDVGSYLVEVRVSDDRGGETLATFVVTIVDPLGALAYREDFELGAPGWEPNDGIWDVGEATSGPGACYEGSQCAGTVLAGNYPAYGSSRLTSAPIRVPTPQSGDRVQLRFWQWFSYSSYDSGTVQVSAWDPETGSWGAWDSLYTVSGVSGVWSPAQVDLDAYAGQDIRLGFLHSATRNCGSCGSESSGWYVDQLEVVSVPLAFSGDFEPGYEDWWVSRGQWEIGEATSGPGACYEGSQCAGTVLAGSYAAYGSSRLTSAPVRVPTPQSGEHAQLRFWQWFSYSSYDSGTVQLSAWDPETGSWGAWDSLYTVSGVSGVWSPAQVDLDAYAGQDIRLGFLHSATRNCGSCGSESSGWYVDQLEVVSVPLAFSGDFEPGYEDWWVSRGQWEIGEATSGPGDCHEGSGCAGTVLAGSYAAYGSSRLTSAPVRVPTPRSGEHAQLRFWQWFSYSSYDSGTVQVSAWDPETGSWEPWVSLYTVSGVSGVWSPAQVDLDAYAGQDIRLGFLHSATRNCGSCGSESSGWYLDQLEVVSVPLAFSGDFERGDEDWWVSRGQWETGEATSGPGACHEGSGCAGTVLAGSYSAYGSSRLTGAPVRVPTPQPGEHAQLRFWQWFSYSSYDSGTVQLSAWDPQTGSWGDWVSLYTVSGVSGVWSPAQVDLDAYAGQDIRLGFLHSATRNCSSCGSESSGWYLDQLEVVSVPLAFSGDFETGYEDWWVSRGQWQVGEATAGPGACYEGSQCAGTVLAGSYSAYGSSRLTSAPVRVPSAESGEHAQLYFRQWYSYSSYDSGTVQVSAWDPVTGSWGAWQSLVTVTGVSGAWLPAQVDLDAYAGQDIRLGFLHSATRNCGSCGSESSGWYLDVIQVVGGAPPALAPVPDTAMDEDGSVSVALTATDPDGDRLTFSVSELPGFAALTDHGDGTASLTFSPGFDDAGLHVLRVSVTDGPYTASDSFVLTVRNVNRAPTIDPIPPQSMDEQTTIEILLAASDPDGEPITLAVFGLPTFGTFSDQGDGNGILRFAPGSDDAGNHLVSITASDGHESDAVSFTLTVGQVNQAPTVETPAARTMYAGNTLLLPVVATDPDGDALVLSVTDLPTFGVFTDGGDGTGSLTFTPAAGDGGSYVVNIRASDGALSASSLFALTVNDGNPPNLVASDVAHPQEGWTGQPIDIGWTITNTGLSPATGPWQDCVYLSDDAVSGSDSLLGCLARPTELEAEEHYARIRTVNVPDVAEGSYWVVVKGDDNNVVTETDENDNLAIAGPFAVHKIPCADVRPGGVELATTTVGAGGTAAVNWFVINGGDGPTNVPTWVDRVYLSADAILDSGDRKVAEAINPMALRPGETYTRNLPFAVPGDLAGNYYVLIKTDAGAGLSECDETNNVAVSAGTLQIEQSLAPNLTVGNVQVVPLQPWPGDTISVSWTLTNTGDTPTGPISLDHALVLSSDTDLDTAAGGDRVLRWHVAGFTANLASGETSRTLSATVTIPRDTWGDHHVIVWPDPPLRSRARTFVASAPITIREPLVADLVVDQVTTVGSGLSGQPIPVGWSVRNAANNLTFADGWQDVLILSRDADARTTADNHALGTFTHSGALDFDEGYDATQAVKLPDEASGSYTLLVCTDRANQVFEGVAGDDNNCRAASAPLVVDFLPADLEVESAVASVDGGTAVSVLSGTPIAMDWSVLNTGAGSTSTTGWSDSLYLSADATLDPADAVLARVAHSGGLDPAARYSSTRVITLPLSFSAPAAHIIVCADTAEQLFESADTNNCRATGAFEVRWGASDLAVPQVELPGVTAAVLSGTAATIEWRVRNEGPGATSASSWSDTVYLSSDPVRDGTDTLLARVGHTGGLGLGDEYAATRSVTIPVTYTEPVAHLIVCADDTERVVETDDDNNCAVSAPVDVTWGPSDLVVPTVTAQADGVTAVSVASGASVTVRWQVDNVGPGATASASWIDRIALSTDDTLDGTDVVIATLARSGVVANGDGYTAESEIQIPIDFTAPQAYVFVTTDQANEVYESNDGNNLGASAPFQVAWGPPDLEVQTLFAEHGVPRGEAIDLTWTVRNRGGPTSVGEWSDRIFHSSDRWLSADDTELTPRSGPLSPHLGVLAHDQGYTRRETIEMPAGTTGYLIVKTDAAEPGQVTESDETNNSAHSALPALDCDSNLVVSVVDAPATAISGQLTSVSWTVVNVGARATNSGGWRDAVYLSRDQFLDPGTDIYAGARDRNGALAGGDGYAPPASLEIRVPSGLTGPYYVFVATDRDGEVCEVDESDNRGFDGIAVDLELPPPTDLVVTDIVLPAPAQLGDSALIEWTVRNQGDFDARGIWHDAVYLSRDTAWDANDHKLGEVRRNGPVAPGSDYGASLNAKLSGVVAGNYYLIVRTDSRAEVREAGIGEQNNLTSSNAPFAVSATELGLGVPDTGHTLTSGTEHIYRIAGVPPGEDLRVSLTPADDNVFTELYLSYEAVPGRASNDYASATPFTAAQELEVPGTRAGDYYVLVRATSVATTPAGYTLSADLLPFEVREVSNSTLGNNGEVTIHVDGSQFTPGTKVRLVDDTGATIAEATPVVYSSTRMAATFNLKDVTTGAYQLQADTASGSTASLRHPVQVVAGSGGRLFARLIVPPNVRPGREYTFWIEYENIGTTDMLAPLFATTAVSIDALGRQLGSLALPGADVARSGSAQALGISFDGPAGVLPPGARYRIPVRFRVPGAGARILFSLNSMVAGDRPIDWAAVRPTAPADVDPELWDAIWRNFSTQNATTSDFLRSLSEAATHLSLEGTRTSDIQTLTGLLMQRATGGFTPRRTLASAVDVALPAPGLPLSFSRVSLDGLAQRFHVGPLGRGWSHGYEYEISFPDPKTAHLRLPGGGVRSFTLLDGDWNAGPSDQALFESLPLNRYRLTEKNGLALTFDALGRLVVLNEPNGNRLTLAYVGDRLIEVSHSSGQSLTLAYDPRGRVARITDATGRVTDYAYDAAGEHLVRVDGPAHLVTRYTYVPVTGSSADHALASVENPDGTHRFYTYDAYGRLTGQSADGGAEALQFSYPALAQVHVVDALGATHRLRVGNSGELLQRIDPLGRVVDLDYDDDLNLTHLQQTNGDSYRFTYDSRGNLTSRTDPLFHRIEFTYEPTLSRLLALRDARGNITTHDYDLDGNLISITTPDRNTEHFAYDAEGNPVEWRNRRGNAIQYVYDNRGLPIRKLYPDGTAIDYGYDGRGNLVSAADASGEIAMQYDEADRPSRIVYPNGRSLGYTYDGSGRRTRMMDQDGFAVNYRYDEVGRLAELTDAAGALVVRYSYDAAGQLTREDKGNGTYTTYSYDSAGQILHLVNHAPGGLVQSRFDYGHDDLGRRVSMGTREGDWTYEYDANGQLTRATFRSQHASVADQDLVYVYDPAGNRTDTVINGDSTTYITNSRNQYEQVGPAVYDYDADGNLQHIHNMGDDEIYVFDDENRLTRVLTPSGETHYEYDNLGNRAASVINGARVESLLDPTGFGDIVGEFDESGDRIATYVHGLGLVSQNTEAAGYSYFDYDSTTNVHDVTDSTGNVQNSYFYAPFGESVPQMDSTFGAVRFSGRHGATYEGNDAYLMRARLFLANIGRFASEDPLLIAPANLANRYEEESNKYTYALNDPISRYDPLGLSFIDAPSYIFGNRYIGEALKYFGGIAQRIGSAARFKIYLHAPFINELGAFGLNATRLAGIPGHAGAMWAGPRFIGASARLFTPIFIGKMLADISVAFGDWLGNYVYDTLPPGYRDPLGDWLTDILYPIDPNDKVGPVTQGIAGYSSSTSPQTYRINFENLPDAGAPAVRVVVVDQLDPDLDLRTIQLEEIGFGETVIHVPGRRSYYSGDVTLNDGLVVGIDAGLDIETRTVTWTLTAIDPATGEIPADATLGFLPPNDPTTGSGEGRVTFSVRPLPSVDSGTEITNTATIIFDANEPIVTNQVFNTVDAGAPSSVVQPLPATTGAEEFLVTWAGQDDAGGAGIASHDVYVSDNGRPYEAWLSETKEAGATFPGRLGHSYRFYSVARDNVGHVETAPPNPDASTTVFFLPGLEDGDGDGLPTPWEEASGTDPAVNDALGDLDGEGISNIDEYKVGTNPWDANSRPEGLNRESFVFFRDHFDDGRYDDRWVLGALDAGIDFGLAETGTELHASVLRPADQCTGLRLQSFASVTAVNTVFRASVRLAGGGRNSLGLMSDQDPGNRVEIHFDVDTAPPLRLRSWDAGVVTEVPAASSVDYLGAKVALELVKTGDTLFLYVNDTLQATVSNSGLGDARLRPYLAQESCAGDAGDAELRLDFVELLRDTDADGRADTNDNCRVAANDDQLDTDDDGAGNVCDDDDDGDGLTDSYETDVLGTNPLLSDTDGDGLADGDEIDTDPLRADVQLQLLRGENFIAFPVVPEPGLDSAAFLWRFAADPMSIGRYDHASGQWQVTEKNAGDVTGPVFALAATEGYLVRIAEPDSERFEGDPIGATTVGLEAGFNLAAVGDGSIELDAVELLESLGGPSVVASISRFDPVTGRFQTVAYDGDEIVGKNFAIGRGEAYLVHMRQAVPYLPLY